MCMHKPKQKQCPPSPPPKLRPWYPVQSVMGQMHDATITFVTSDALALGKKTGFNLIHGYSF